MTVLDFSGKKYANTFFRANDLIVLINNKLPLTNHVILIRSKFIVVCEDFL